MGRLRGAVGSGRPSFGRCPAVGSCEWGDAAGSRVYFWILAAFSIGGAKFGSFVRARRSRTSGNMEFLIVRWGRNWGNFGRGVFTAETRRRGAGGGQQQAAGCWPQAVVVCGSLLVGFGVWGGVSG